MRDSLAREYARATGRNVIANRKLIGVLTKTVVFINLMRVVPWKPCHSKVKDFWCCNKLMGSHRYRYMCLVIINNMWLRYQVVRELSGASKCLGRNFYRRTYHIIVHARKYVGKYWRWITSLMPKRERVREYCVKLCELPDSI